MSDGGRLADRTGADQPRAISVCNPKEFEARIRLNGENRKRRFRLHSLQSSCQEAPAAGHSFDRSKAMLDGAATNRHQIGILVDSPFHPVERALVHKPVNRALVSRRALPLDQTGLTGRRSVSNGAVTGVLALRVHDGAGRTAYGVHLFIMNELHGPEVFGTHGTPFDRGGDANAILFATCNFLRVRVSPIGQNVQFIDLEDLFRGDGHRMEQLAVVGLVGNVVMNNQAAFDINDTLHIVCGELRCTAITHRSCVRFSEDDDIRGVIAKLGLPLLQSRLPAFQRTDSLGKGITMNGLIRNPLGRVLIGDVETAEIVGDFRFGMRDVEGKASAPAIFLALATARILVPSSAALPPAISPASRQKRMKAAPAPTMASGLSCRNAAIVR